MNKEKTYDAFISYRHLKMDEQMARSIQFMLETYRQPKGIAVGKKIQRIFRDKTELPTSKDLDDAIKEALADSEFLIVILSEHFQESDWCMEELKTFIQLHDGKTSHILPVLLSGDPHRVMPEELLHDKVVMVDESGNEDSQTVKREPICADIRGKNVFMRMWKLMTEFLRLAAPMLNCGFDDLYQRHKRRRQIQGVALLTVITFIIAGYAGILFHNYQQIKQKNQELQLNESRLLTESAWQSLQGGNTAQAIMDAASALPQDAQDDRPYYAPAETVLWEVMGEQKNMLGESHNHTFNLELMHSSYISAFRLSSDGRRCFTIDAYGTVRCFNLENGSVEWETDLVIGGYVMSSEECFLLSEKNNCIYTCVLDTDDVEMRARSIVSIDCDSGEITDIIGYGISMDGTMILSQDEKTLCYLTEAPCYFYSVHESDASKNDWIINEPRSSLYQINPETGVFADNDSAHFMGVYYEESNERYYRHFYIVDQQTRRWDDVYIAETERIGKIWSLRYMHDQNRAFVVFESGENIFGSGKSIVVSCIDIKKGKLCWEETIKASNYYTDMCDPQVLYDDEYDLLLVSCGDTLYAFDCILGNVEAQLNFDSKICNLYPVGDLIYGSCLENGHIYAMGLTDYGFDLTSGDNEGITLQTEAHNIQVACGGLLNAEWIDTAWGTETIAQSKGNGLAVYMPLGNIDKLFVTKNISFSSLWEPCLTIERQQEEQLMMISHEAPAFVDGDTVYMVSSTYPDKDGLTTYSIIQLDTRSLQSVRTVFCSDKEIRYDLLKEKIGGGIYPTSNHTGFLIDAGDGDLLFYNAYRGDIEVLYKTDEPAGKTQIQNDEESVRGNYVLSAKRAGDSVFSAVVDAGRLQHWKDGKEGAVYPLPNDMIWTSSENNILNRVLLVGANGYALLSDFKSEQEDTISKFAVCDLKTGKWYSIEDEMHGSADRLINQAHSLPLFAVMDTDRVVRIYGIAEGRCVRSIQLPVSSYSVKSIGFSEDDKFFYACASGNIYIYSMEDGHLVYKNQIWDSGDHVVVMTDKEGKKMYIRCGYAYSYGYYVDMQSWTQIAMIQKLKAFIPETNSMLIGWKIHRIPGTQELIDTAWAAVGAGKE